MRATIKFSDGKVLLITDDNYLDEIKALTDDQKAQLATLLRSRLGERNPLPVDVDREVYELWYEDTHRDDVIPGGGGSSDGSKINPKGGKKYSVKDWHNKGDSDRNLVWLRNRGFRKRWDKRVGYRYLKDGLEVDVNWIESLDHEAFKVMVSRMIGGIDLG